MADDISSPDAVAKTSLSVSEGALAADSSLLKHPLWSGIIITLVAATLSTVATHYLQGVQVREAFGLSSVQSRISGCLALAEHHRHFMSSSEKPVQVILDDGTLTVASTNHERFSASINTARALSLCLVNKANFQEVEDCILLTTTDGSGTIDNYVSVIDTKSSKPPVKENAPWPGQRNPSC
jgi:hypothetical protein